MNRLITDVVIRKMDEVLSSDNESITRIIIDSIIRSKILNRLTKADIDKLHMEIHRIELEQNK